MRLLLWKWMVLVRRAIVRLVSLRIWCTHGSHWSCWHLSKNMWPLSIVLHVNDLLRLMPLLRSLMTHHLSASWSWAWEAVSTRRCRHLSWIMRINRAWSWRVHLHLWICRHTHERSARWLIGHHVPTHCRACSVDELMSSRLSESNMLHTRAHTISLHRRLLLEYWYSLGLPVVNVRRHGTG